MSADPRFHRSAGPLPLSVLARAAGLEAPEGAGERPFRGAAPLAAAGPEEIAFLDGRRWLAALRESRAGAVVLAAEHAGAVPAGTLALVSPHPVLAFARVAAALHPATEPDGTLHPTAVIGEGAVLGAGCEVGPYAVVGAGAVLGARCLLGPHVHVGPGCVFGDDCRLLSHASASHTLAGDRVTLHPGARVGSEGFGFATSGEGEHVTVPQLGRVILGDGAEVGANACVDRGSGGDTVIGPGARLDNLVMIGHNVRMGRGCVVVGQAGIAGSATLGDFVVVAAQAGLNGHIGVGDRARIGAQAGVMGDVEAGTDVLGSPAWPARETFRAIAALRRLGQARPGRGGDGEKAGG